MIFSPGANRRAGSPTCVVSDCRRCACCRAIPLATPIPSLSGALLLLLQACTAAPSPPRGAGGPSERQARKPGRLSGPSDLQTPAEVTAWGRACREGGSRTCMQFPQYRLRRRRRLPTTMDLFGSGLLPAFASPPVLVQRPAPCPGGRPSCSAAPWCATGPLPTLRRMPPPVPCRKRAAPAWCTAWRDRNRQPAVDRPCPVPGPACCPAAGMRPAAAAWRVGPASHRGRQPALPGRPLPLAGPERCRIRGGCDTARHRPQLSVRLGAWILVTPPGPREVAGTPASCLPAAAAACSCGGVRAGGCPNAGRRGPAHPPYPCAQRHRRGEPACAACALRPPAPAAAAACTCASELAACCCPSLAGAHHPGGRHALLARGALRVEGPGGGRQRLQGRPQQPSLIHHPQVK